MMLKVAVNHKIKTEEYNSYKNILAKAIKETKSVPDKATVIVAIYNTFWLTDSIYSRALKSGYTWTVPDRGSHSLIADAVNTIVLSLPKPEYDKIKYHEADKNCLRRYNYVLLILQTEFKKELIDNYHGQRSLWN